MWLLLWRFIIYIQYYFYSYCVIFHFHVSNFSFYLRIPEYNDKASKIILYIVSSLSFLGTLYFLFDVSTTSPGYIPRSNVDVDEYIKNPKVIKLKDVEMELKACETCKTIRGPRSFHCSLCGNCIEKHGKKLLIRSSLSLGWQLCWWQKYNKVL